MVRWETVLLVSKTNSVTSKSSTSDLVNHTETHTLVGGAALPSTRVLVRVNITALVDLKLEANFLQKVHYWGAKLM